MGEVGKSKFVGDAKMKKYAMPIIMLAVFETVAITLWLTKNNLFYLFNFSYIGLSISLGVFLYEKNISTQGALFNFLSVCTCLSILG